jgi:hypothetical protein
LAEYAEQIDFLAGADAKQAFVEADVQHDTDVPRK